MRELTLRDALCEAMRQEMRRDPKVLLIGEDVGVFGGPLKTSRGLIEEFGPERVVDSPICEPTMVGIGLGMALMGYRPIVEVMYIDLLTLAVDQLVNHVSKMHYMTGGQSIVPMVIRTATGSVPGRGIHHGQALEALFTNIPGLKVVLPTTPYEAKGMLISAIRDPNPILFIEHKKLYAMKGEVPEEAYTLPLNRADVKREGTDVTVAAYGIMVPAALEAADELQKKGISIEVVDLRALTPLDKETILSSARKTGRLVIAHEAWKDGGIGADVSALVAEEALTYLDAPILRVGAPHAHIPYSPLMEEAYLPKKADIVAAVEITLGAA